MEIPKIVGAGIVVLGVGIGLGKIGAAALEAIARQPEQSGKSKQLCLSQLHLLKVLRLLLYSQ
jgi:F0F1-type ATP synthase membrane subunit c/vacuolar-type H+-ATPase subunit K